MEIRSFRDLRTWRSGKLLAVRVYELTRTFPDSERYGLVSQLRRAAVSVPSNIAEGMGRSTTKDLIRFLTNARGSVFELLTQLEISRDLSFVPEQRYTELTKEYELLGMAINKHISSLAMRN